MNCNNPPLGNSLQLKLLQSEITACERCPRLIEHCREVARTRRRAYREQEYWGRPVPSFGDPAAHLLVLGLAPGAHGANRTGRVFTGDSSGDLLFRVLHETGYASQPTSTHSADGLQLRGAWITCSTHCAPPDNRPSPQEVVNCRAFLERELRLLTHLKTVVALGQIAFHQYLAVLRGQGSIPRLSDFPFGHNRRYDMGPELPALVGSYHPSRQNTSTGKLTESMLRDVFAFVHNPPPLP